MRNASFPFHHFDSPLHREWKHDRAIRQRAPRNNTGRGCVGLALMWRNVDADFECQGDRIYYANDNLAWLCLRDIPAGHFPGYPARNRREVSLAGTAVASLHHGMPKLEFATPAGEIWDFAKMPYATAEVRRSTHLVKRWKACGDTLNSDEYPREFAVLNRLSAAMTRQAYYGDNVPRRGRTGRAILRRAKFPALFVPPRQWFPTPLLAFREAEVRAVLAKGGYATRISLKMRPGLIFVPVYTAATALAGLAALDLIWDVSAVEPFVQPDVEAAVFPPLACRRWDELRFNVRDVDVDAGVHDVRFEPNVSIGHDKELAQKSMSISA